MGDKLVGRKLESLKIAALLVFLTAGLLAGCADPHRFGDRQAGPPADVEAIRSYERRVWEHGASYASGGHVATGIVVEGDVALATVMPDAGWTTTVFRRSGQRWIPLAEKTNAPGACLFEAAHIGGARARALGEALFRVAPWRHVYPDDRQLRPDRPGFAYRCSAPR